MDQDHDTPTPVTVPEERVAAPTPHEMSEDEIRRRRAVVEQLERMAQRARDLQNAKGADATPARSSASAHSSQENSDHGA